MSATTKLDPFQMSLLEDIYFAGSTTLSGYDNELARSLWVLDLIMIEGSNGQGKILFAVTDAGRDALPEIRRKS